MNDLYVIGVDGGGTKTHAVAYLKTPDGLGEVVGECTTGPCNIAFMPLKEALENFISAVDGCGVPRSDVFAVGGAVAGYSFVSRRAEFMLAFRDQYGEGRTPLTSVNFLRTDWSPDFVAAFHGAFPEGRGILVIAGTGSVAYGVGENRWHRSGGYGYLIDDAGSGYGVGRAAIAALLHEIDGCGEPTSLTSRIGTELSLSSWDDMIEGVYGGRIDRVKIAALAQIVSVAAHEDNDAVAGRILMKAGGALAKLAETVYSHIAASGAPLPIARVGSLWSAGPILTDVFERSCARFAPDCEFVEPKESPNYGAALSALNSCR